MTTIPFPSTTYSPQVVPVSDPVASAVFEGLTTRPRRLPPWLFYDAVGSWLFERITDLPEYYLTRTERGIFSDFAGEIVDRAAEGERLRITELGAGSAEKTLLLLRAARDRQERVVYEPVDVSASALDAARERVEREIDGAIVAPRVEDYTVALDLGSAAMDERRLVLYIGSSIGNFEPQDATELLMRIREALRPGDGLLLGVDLAKDESILLAAYDDSAGVTAEFNLNLLARLNRELGADFNLRAFRHKATWDPSHSRMQMYLESLVPQKVRVAALGLDVEFALGERIHTENSYKYTAGAGGADA